MDRQTQGKTERRIRTDWTTDGRTHKYTLGKIKQRSTAYVFVVNVNKYSSFIPIKGPGRSYQ